MATKEEQLYEQLLASAPGDTVSAETKDSAAQLAAAENTVIPNNYSGSYDSKVNAAINKWLADKGFSYSPAADKNYQAYLKEYELGANRGRELSSVTAHMLANGYAPTYADAVADGVYNQHMMSAGDAAPSFKSLAQQEYTGNNNRLANGVNIYSALDSTDYSRSRDVTADYKNYLNYLYNRYSTDRQSDVDRDSANADIYSAKLASAQSSLSDMRNYNNQRYLYDVQSADSKAKLAENEYENNQKIAYSKAEDSYKAKVNTQQAAQKATTKEQEAKDKAIENKYIADYDLKNIMKNYENGKDYNGYDYVANQIAIGYFRNKLSRTQTSEIAEQLKINMDDVIAFTKEIEREDRRNGRA